MFKNFRAIMRNKEGFTLVELIIVMAILAVLAGIAVPKFANVLAQSKIKAHNTNVEMLENAVETYSAQTDTALETINAADSAAIKTLLVDSGYLKAVPDQPVTGADEYTIVAGAIEPVKATYDPSTQVWVMPTTTP